MKICKDCKGKKSDHGNYCKKCGYKHRVRPKGLKYVLHVKNKGWFEFKGGWVDEGGYKKTHRGRVHVLVMQEKLGRKLSKNEVVHHIDGDKLNNNVENLQLLTKEQHDYWHMGKRKVGLCVA